MIVETVNLHVWSKCNLKCVYCYETFPEAPRSLPIEGWKRVLDLLASEGVVRVTFSGGEPTLHPDLLAMLEHTRRAGLQASIITNGAKLTDEMLALLDLVGITLDAVDDKVLAALGRAEQRGPGYLHRVRDVARRAASRGVPLKINTVVTRSVLEQDLRSELLRLRPAKWKPMQFTEIEGENEHHSRELSVSAAQFSAFVQCHRPALEAAGIWVAAEAATTIQDSYVMVDPCGRMFQTIGGVKRRSGPLLELGLSRALAEVGGYDRAAFLARGGARNARHLRVLDSSEGSR